MDTQKSTVESRGKKRKRKPSSKKSSRVKTFVGKTLQPTWWNRGWNFSKKGCTVKGFPLVCIQHESCLRTWSHRKVFGSVKDALPKLVHSGKAVQNRNEAQKGCGQHLLEVLRLEGTLSLPKRAGRSWKAFPVFDESFMGRRYGRSHSDERGKRVFPVAW